MGKAVDGFREGGEKAGHGKKPPPPPKWKTDRFEDKNTKPPPPPQRKGK